MKVPKMYMVTQKQLASGFSLFNIYDCRPVTDCRETDTTFFHRYTSSKLCCPYELKYYQWLFLGMLMGHIANQNEILLVLGNGSSKGWHF